MKALKQLAISGLLGLSLTVGALQTAHADTAAAYNQVYAVAQQAAKEAFAADMRGARATCYIADKAKAASVKAGLKPNTADYNAVVSRTTYYSAKSNKIKDLLKNEVTLECGKAAALTRGSMPSAAVVGGVVLAIAGVAAASGGSSNSTSSRPPSP
jgi:hypothetical protein